MGYLYCTRDKPTNLGAYLTLTYLPLLIIPFTFTAILVHTHYVAVHTARWIGYHCETLFCPLAKFSRLECLCCIKLRNLPTLFK